MARNWGSVEAGQLSMQKIIRLRKKTALMMNANLKENELYDPLKDEVVHIKDVSNTSLGRIYKSLNAMYKASDPSFIEVRQFILSKKQLIDNELSKRYDV